MSKNQDEFSRAGAACDEPKVYAHVRSVLGQLRTAGVIPEQVSRPAHYLGIGQVSARGDFRFAVDDPGSLSGLAVH